MNAPSDFCAAYGCPLFGTLGAGGKWYCGCHFNANASLNDAITLEIGRNQALVDHILLARREHRPDAKAEQQLYELTRGTGAQIPMAPITGPTSGHPHFSETDA
jgi:hypothetical protein